MRTRTKIAIVGTGQVGTATAFELIITGLVDDLVLIDLNAQAAASQAMDLNQAASAQSFGTVVTSGDYTDCGDADIVVITASAKLAPGADRGSLLQSSSAIVDSIVPAVVEAGFHGIFVVITNPVDVITERVAKLSGFPRDRVIGTGTALDSLRVRLELARIFSVDEQSIQAYAMGEHGDTQMVPWSAVSFWGKPLDQAIADNPERASGVDPDTVLDDAKRSAFQIVKGKGTTSFGIAATTCSIIASIVRDEHSIIPVSVRLEGEYGHRDVCAGVPVILGGNGIQEVVNIHLSDAEKKAFDASLEHIRTMQEAMPPLPERG
ncbi:L-lactate dehydrogenase [Acidipropionibacterium jensenii]|uniref:L-lactate dehydrogenase n=1 Tax=Acidipropionibacterium jensenii TaxID=1749 RepID=UPI00264716C1|nr:L-lactate dehydrogenase [Acidipropionibacterium jensenii]MDN6592917.1 L-lactate dehydrogenase [Acidipropionibacterium jensenii]